MSLHNLPGSGTTTYRQSTIAWVRVNMCILLSCHLCWHFSVPHLASSKQSRAVKLFFPLKLSRGLNLCLDAICSCCQPVVGNEFFELLTGSESVFIVFFFVFFGAYIGCRMFCVFGWVHRRNCATGSKCWRSPVCSWRVSRSLWYSLSFGYAAPSRTAQKIECRLVT